MMTEEQLESQKKEWWVKFPELGECDVIFFVEPPKKGGGYSGICGLVVHMCPYFGHRGTNVV